MPVDYVAADRLIELSFGKLNRPGARMDFPKPSTLASELASLHPPGVPPATFPHGRISLFASASVEMWHRAIHSFLWSVALTETSPLWASVSGYYASHFTMRAFAHCMGLFKSFRLRKAVQVKADQGQFVCATIQTADGEHPFYWGAVKDHPALARNPLFRDNHERDDDSDSAHRTFANYTDHVNSFIPLGKLGEVASNVEKISRIRLHSVTRPSRDDYPDLQNVQILAFQRIVAFHDFLDTKISQNRFWKAHRRPVWCKDQMLFVVQEPELEEPLVA